MYVFDTSPLSTLFKNYYPSRFPSLWKKFDALIANGQIVSSREVMRELTDGPVPNIVAWIDANKDVFPSPTAAEAAFVAKIFQVPHFQNTIEQQKLLKGGRNADPFVIAKAAVAHRTVVTMEVHKPNSFKIPTICSHFQIPCLTLEDFMEQEGWSF